MTEAHDRAMWAQTPLGRQWENLLDESQHTVAMIDDRRAAWEHAWEQGAQAAGLTWPDSHGPRVAHHALADSTRMARSNTVLFLCGCPPVLVACAAIYQWLPTIVSTLILWCYFAALLFWVITWARSANLLRGNDDAYVRAARHDQRNREWWIRRYGFDVGPQRDPDLNGSWCSRGPTAPIRAQLTALQQMDYTQVRDRHVQELTDQIHLPLREDVPEQWPAPVRALMQHWRDQDRMRAPDHPAAAALS